MSKTLRYGSHSFPSSAGFTGSTGKLIPVRAHSRKPVKPGGFVRPKISLNSVEVAQSETSPKGKFARTVPPVMGAYPSKPKLNAPVEAINPGTSMQRAKSRKISQLDVNHGSSAPLRPGYKKGGMVKPC